MALDSTWWSSGYTAQRWLHNYASVSTSSGSDGTSDWNYIQLVNIYYIYGCESFGNFDSKFPIDKNIGRYYAKKDSDGAVRELPYQIPNQNTLRQPCDPIVDNIEMGHDDYLGRYRSPFGGVSTVSFRTESVIWYETPGSGTATFSLRHYQPWAYYGSPAAAIGAMLRHLGLSSDRIDTALFSDADDAYAAMSPNPILYYRREIDEEIGNSIKRIIRHTYDYLAINMASEISLISRDDPPSGPTALTADDVLDEPQWRYAEEHLCNRAIVGHGQYVSEYTSNDALPAYPGALVGPGTPSWDRGSAWDPGAALDLEGQTVDSYENAASQTKYGVIVADETSVRTVEEGIEISRPAIRFPYCYDVDMKDVILDERIGNDSTLRREAHVRQDMMGADYDIGYKVGNVAVTGDGQTIADTRCVRKRVDFDKMAIESWLLEEPA